MCVELFELIHQQCNVMDYCSTVASSWSAVAYPQICLPSQKIILAGHDKVEAAPYIYVCSFPGILVTSYVSLSFMLSFSCIWALTDSCWLAFSNIALMLCGMQWCCQLLVLVPVPDQSCLTCTVAPRVWALSIQSLQLLHISAILGTAKVAHSYYTRSYRSISAGGYDAVNHLAFGMICIPYTSKMLLSPLPLPVGSSTTAVSNCSRPDTLKGDHWWGAPQEACCWCREARLRCKDN